MNELFKNGDYVLLEDCKAFDKKYELEKSTTMWAVARKMEGSEFDQDFMDVCGANFCIGIRKTIVGVWLIDDSLTTKLSVEDVLYRSEDGLTINELREIHGAFEEGKEYECTNGSPSVYTKGCVYKANGQGIKDDLSYSTGGHVAKFKPITDKPEWVPSVGDEVMYEYQICIIDHIKGELAWISRGESDDLVHLSSLGPIDKERERIIQSVVDLAENLDDSYTSRDLAEKLHDAGMLKEGDK